MSPRHYLKSSHKYLLSVYIFAAAGGGGGGFPEVSEENPAGQVLVYIASDDIDADLKNVKKLGGKVLRENTEIPGMGWFGIFQDPTGNVLAVYTSANPANN